MKVLGLDPGSHRFGWAVLDFQARPESCVCDKPVRIDSGVIVCKFCPHCTIARKVTEIIQKHRPEIAAIELPYVDKEHRLDTAIILAQARGAALAAVESHGLMVIDLRPSSVKKTVTGKGNATKATVARWVELKTGYGTDETDESDAIACAIAGAKELKQREMSRRTV